MNMHVFGNSANDHLIDELTKYIMTLTSVDVEKVRNDLSSILTNYHVVKIEKEDQSDIQEKIQMFLAAKQLDGLSKLTLDGYKIELRLFAKFVKKRVENITSADIRAYLSSKPELQMSTIGRKLSTLKAFFGWLHDEEIIQRNPTAKLKPPKTPDLMAKALSIEELEMLRESCQTRRQRALIEVMYATGCRLSEVYNMNRNDINHQTMSAVVIGKGNKEREVYFSFKAMYHLKKYLETRNDNCPALFVTERKPYRRLSRRAIQDEIKKIARNAGLEDKVHPHVLRHTFATLTLNNGADLVAVQELLGHSKPETTLRYARITEERKREQHRKFLVQESGAIYIAS